MRKAERLARQERQRRIQEIKRQTERLEIQKILNFLDKKPQNKLGYELKIIKKLAEEALKQLQPAKTA